MYPRLLINDFHHRFQANLTAPCIAINEERQTNVALPDLPQGSATDVCRLDHLLLEHWVSSMLEAVINRSNTNATGKDGGKLTRGAQGGAFSLLYVMR